MDTKEIIKGVLPEIERQLITSDFNIGDREPGYNEFTFDQDGWYITFTFDLSGKWVRGYGIDHISSSVSALSVEHYDEDTDEDTIFNDDDLFMFREDLEAIINNIF